MSEDQKKTIELPVDYVENWIRGMNYLADCINFWNVEKKWPINLVFDCLILIQDEMKELIKENVSVSHIIDK